MSLNSSLDGGESNGKASCPSLFEMMSNLLQINSFVCGMKNSDGE